jgi:hypothetical protein
VISIAAVEKDSLTEFNALRDALALTHTEIPRLLAAERDRTHQLGAQGRNRKFFTLPY